MDKLPVRDLCHIAIFTTIITLMAQISIPIPCGIPMTMQTFAVPFAGIILGAKKGALSALAYILLGAIGVPVFANFTGGIGIVFGITGGFILSFPIMALAAGIGEDKNNKIWLIAGLIIGAIINYLCGMLWFSLFINGNLKTAFMVCILPFIPTAVIKIILAAVLGKQIKNVLVKGKILEKK